MFDFLVAWIILLDFFASDASLVMTLLLCIHCTASWCALHSYTKIKELINLLCIYFALHPGVLNQQM
jgi:hypothetical protein